MGLIGGPTANHRAEQCSLPGPPGVPRRPGGPSRPEIPGRPRSPFMPDRPGMPGVPGPPFVPDKPTKHTTIHLKSVVSRNKSTVKSPPSPTSAVNTLRESVHMTISNVVLRSFVNQLSSSISNLQFLIFLQYYYASHSVGYNALMTVVCLSHLSVYPSVLYMTLSRERNGTAN